VVSFFGVSAEPERACSLGICDGSGWILGPEDVARPCECRDQRLKRGRSRGVASTIPPKFRGVSFERPPVSGQIDKTAVALVRDYVVELERNLRSGRGLWLMGNTGTGKTTLAMLVSKHALAAGHSVAIYAMPKLLARIRSTYQSEDGDSYLQFFERLSQVDLLHLDDFGAEKKSDWVLEQLYSILNERYEQERSIVVTTNLDREEWTWDSSKRGSRSGNPQDKLPLWVENLEKDAGKRTVSRLIEICGDPIPMFGVDSRIELPPRSGGITSLR
jgi:DNA replication protein DnaC